MQTQEGMVNEGIELDAGLDSKASTYDTTSTKQQDESSSLGHAADAELKVHRVTNCSKLFNMLLLKEDNVNTGKQRLGFEILNDVENPFIFNKAKELTPSLYNIDEMGKDMLSDHKIILKKS
ncbi:hypothetical protein Tco_0212072 [Tanacetum coccineum]